MSTILSYGYYFPKHFAEEKIFSGKSGKKGKSRIAYVDEDIITLGYEATLSCLGENRNIDAILFSTTSPVFKNRYHASFLAGLLNFPNEILALDFGSTPRATTDAMIIADQLLESGKYRNILLVASEIHYSPVGEETHFSPGHSAVAILLGKEKGIAEIHSSHSYSSEIAEEFNYKNKRISYDSRFSKNAGIKTSLLSTLGKNKFNPVDFDALILNSLYSKMAGGIFFKAGFSENHFAKDNLLFNTGYTGCCHGLFQLIDAIESDKKNILLFDYFNGTNVLKIKSNGSLGKKNLQNQLESGYGIETYQDYLMLRKGGDFNSEKYKTVEMFSSEMMNVREKETIHFLQGFECEKCGTVYFIRSARCKKCKNEKFRAKKLKKTGTVYSLAREQYFPHSFAPITMAVIDLENGGRITLQATDDMYPAEKDNIKIGSNVKLVLRKMIENDSNPNYFWKAVQL